MRNNFLKITFLAFCFLFSGFLISQQKQVVRDFGVRAGINFEYKFKGPYKLKIMADIRTFYNSSKIESNVLDAEFERKISKNFRLSTHIRYVRNRKKDGYFYHDLRNDYDLKYTTGLTKKLKLRYRARYQKTYANLMRFDRSAYDPAGNKSNFRNKVNFTYKISDKYKPFVSFEIFKEFILFRRPVYNKFRVNLGNQFEIKNNKFSLGFSYERDWSDSKPFNFFFLKIYYELNYKRK